VTGVDSLTDPGARAERNGVEVAEKSATVPAEAFDHYDELGGEVAVGVTNADGAVLLWTDADHGWLLPAAPVDPGEDYAAAARRVVERLADTDVAVTGVERVRRVRYAVEDDDRETTAYHVLVRAAATDEPLPDSPDGPDGATVDWFDAVPEAVHSENERGDVTAFVPDESMTDPTPTDPTESLTDPGSLADRDGVDYVEIEDDSHFEMNRDTEGVAVVGVTNDDGELALATSEAGSVVAHAVVKSGDGFADTAREAANELLGVDVELEAIERVRRKESTSDDGKEAVAYDVVFAASITDDADLPEQVPSCQVESTGWYDSLPEDFAYHNDEMCDDARLFVE